MDQRYDESSIWPSLTTGHGQTMIAIISSATNTRVLALGLRQPAHRIGRLAHRIGWGAQAIRRTEIVIFTEQKSAPQVLNGVVPLR